MADDDFSLFSNSNGNTVRIQNNKGENNCYVNVLIHSTFYFEEFYNAILGYDLAKSPQKINLLIEYQKVLQQYHQIRLGSGSSTMLDPTAFKIEIGELLKINQLNQLNEQRDPIELLIILFTAFHSYHVNPLNATEVKDDVCNPKCFIHDLFYLKLVETRKCAQCSTLSQINYDTNYFVYELYVIDVFRLIHSQRLNINAINGKLFEYSKTITKQSEVHCEKHKEEAMAKALICEQSSKFLLINLVWDSMKPKVELLALVFDMIALSIVNRDLFEMNEQEKVKAYELKGIILYWNVHYVCAFYDTGAWLLYDDMKIDQLESWEVLIRHLEMNHYQPICLFYKEKAVNKQTSIVDIVQKPNEQLNSKETITIQSKESKVLVVNTEKKPTELLKDILPEFSKPFKVEDKKPKNTIRKKIVLVNNKEAKDNGKLNQSPLEKNDIPKESKVQMIPLPKTMKTKEANSSLPSMNECRFCHQKKKTKKQCLSCGGDLQLNQELHLPQLADKKKTNK